MRKHFTLFLSALLLMSVTAFAGGKDKRKVELKKAPTVAENSSAPANWWMNTTNLAQRNLNAVQITTMPNGFSTGAYYSNPTWYDPYADVMIFAHRGVAGVPGTGRTSYNLSLDQGETWESDIAGPGDSFTEPTAATRYPVVAIWNPTKTPIDFNNPTQRVIMGGPVVVGGAFSGFVIASDIIANGGNMVRTNFIGTGWDFCEAPCISDDGANFFIFFQNKAQGVSDSIFCLRSTDGGVSFTKTLVADTSSFSQSGGRTSVFGLVGSDYRNGVLYLAVYGQLPAPNTSGVEFGFFTSTDNGQTWSSLISTNIGSIIGPNADLNIAAYTGPQFGNAEIAFAVDGNGVPNFFVGVVDTLDLGPDGLISYPLGQNTLSGYHQIRYENNQWTVTPITKPRRLGFQNRHINLQGFSLGTPKVSRDTSGTQFKFSFLDMPSETDTIPDIFSLTKPFVGGSSPTPTNVSNSPTVREKDMHTPKYAVQTGTGMKNVFVYPIFGNNDQDNTLPATVFGVVGTKLSVGNNGSVLNPGADFRLAQNYPNPFNPTTNITYVLPKTENVSLKVYDVLGREVATLVNEVKPAGVYTVPFNASNLASGVYFYKLQAGSFVQTKKMMLVK